MDILRKFKISIIVGILSGVLIGLIDLFPFTICFSIILSFLPGIIAATWLTRKNLVIKTRSVATVSFFTGIICGTIWAISKFILILLIGGLGILSNYFGNETLTAIFAVIVILLFFITCGVILVIGAYNALTGIILFKIKKWYQTKKLEEEHRAKRISQEEVEKNYSDCIEVEYDYIEDN